MCSLRAIALPAQLLAQLSDKQAERAKLFMQVNVGRGFYRVRAPVGVSAFHAANKTLPPILSNILDVTPLLRSKLKSLPTSLEVEESGEPIEFVRWILIVGNVVEMFEREMAKTGDYCDLAKARYKARLASKDERVCFFVQDYHDALVDGPPRAQVLDDYHESSRRFFLNIDLHTHPKLKSDDRRLTYACSHSSPILQSRVCARIATNSCGMPERLSDAHILPITSLFEASLARNLGDDLDHLADAFESFAAGELRWQLPHGEWMTQPSSGLFFLFGEFALAAYENTQSVRWLAMARSMIGAQEIFMAAYQRRETESGFNTYSGCNYKGRVCQALKHHIRRRYCQLDYGDLLCQAGLNGYVAFPDFRS